MRFKSLNERFREYVESESNIPHPNEKFISNIVSRHQKLCQIVDHKNDFTETIWDILTPKFERDWFKAVQKEVQSEKTNFNASNDIVLQLRAFEKRLLFGQNSRLSHADIEGKRSVLVEQQRSSHIKSSVGMTFDDYGSTVIVKGGSIQFSQLLLWSKDKIHNQSWNISKDIIIIALDSIHINADLKVNCNLTIIAPKIYSSYSTIDLSGSTGRQGQEGKSYDYGNAPIGSSGQRGSHGSRYRHYGKSGCNGLAGSTGSMGSRGGDGTDGTDGSPSGNLFIYTDDFISYSSLKIFMNGGNGGKGGKGGKGLNGGEGGPGGNGGNGQSADGMWFGRGGNGGAGGRGGNGGEGGNGGRGGNGGKRGAYGTCYCNKEVPSSTNSTGNSGQGGAGGRAGNGGSYGSGGAAGGKGSGNSMGSSSDNGSQGSSGKQGANGSPGQSGLTSYDIIDSKVAHAKNIESCVSHNKSKYHDLVNSAGCSEIKGFI